MAEQFLTYKGRPLVRGGNTIYYGNMSDDYVCVLQILSTKEENGGMVREIFPSQAARIPTSLRSWASSSRNTRTC